VGDGTSGEGDREGHEGRFQRIVLDGDRAQDDIRADNNAECIGVKRHQIVRRVFRKTACVVARSAAIGAGPAFESSRRTNQPPWVHVQGCGFLLLVK
jgi:hypothetical protein